MVGKFYYEGQADLEEINKSNNNKIELVFVPDLEEEVLNLINGWEKKI